MKLKRRLLLSSMALAMYRSPAAATVEETAGPTYKVSARQLQRVIEERFPMRYPVGDLFNLDVEAPRLRLLPELNRLASELAVQAAGPALRRSYRGSVDVDFAMRYEPGDQSIRAHALRVHGFRLPGLPPQTLRLLDAYGQAVAQQALLEVVLHRLQPRELALADAMDLQPGNITVAPDGLVIGFVRKR